MAEILITTKEELHSMLADVIGKMSNHETNSPTLNEDGYLTKKEASFLFKVSPNTIDNYRRRKLIKSYKIGNNVRFKKSELMEAIEGKLNNPKKASK